jgi:hypothetical protein
MVKSGSCIMLGGDGEEEEKGPMHKVEDRPERWNKHTLQPTSIPLPASCPSIPCRLHP